MSKKTYVYNEKTLQYEAVIVSPKIKFLRFFSIASIFILVFGTSYAIYTGVISSPNERSLKNELSQMDRHYNALTSEFEEIARDLDNIQEKDANIHRIIFGLNPIDSNVWEGGIGGHDRFKYITKYDSSSELIEASLDKVDLLKRKLSIQKKSLDTIFNLALVREEKLASIPSIKPIQEDKLKRSVRYMSGFGFRIHPVHKVKKFHKGIDFTCPVGTPIQATGNGVIKKIQNKRIGYGKHIVIDHGFGYETLYAHLSEIHVKVGQKIIKGQKIGEVGSTGTSTAPHLHYEVRIKGKAVNPIDYCLDGLSVSEYQELVEQTSIENQSFD